MFRPSEKFCNTTGPRTHSITSPDSNSLCVPQEISVVRASKRYFTKISAGNLNIKQTTFQRRGHGKFTVTLFFVLCLVLAQGKNNAPAPVLQQVYIPKLDPWRFVTFGKLRDISINESVNSETILVQALMLACEKDARVHTTQYRTPVRQLCSLHRTDAKITCQDRRTGTFR